MLETLGPLSAFGLVLARSLGLVWSLAWLVGAGGAGLRTRVVAAAVIAVALTAMVGPRLEPPADPLAMGVRAVVEVAAGAALGLAAGLIVAAARLAGEIIGVQAGLASAAVIDPGADASLQGGGTTPLATLAGLIAMATFVALDGPFRLLLALAESYRLDPPLAGIDARASFAAVGQALGLALRMALPAAMALLTAQVAIGLLTRAAPALSAFTAWLPARVAIGLLLALVGAAGFASTLASAWSSLLAGG